MPPRMANHERRGAARVPYDDELLIPQNQQEDQHIPVAPGSAAPASVVTFSDEQFSMLIQALSREPPAPAQAPEPVVDRFGVTVEARFLTMLRKSLIQTFDGKSMDHAAADAWIYQLETGLDEINCLERLKAHCGAAMLKEGARYWWDSTARSIDRVDGVIPWETFKAKFLDKYYPKTYKYQMEKEFLTLSQGSRSVTNYKYQMNKYQMKKEFLTLSQGSRSVTDYERDFDRLSCFAPDQVDTEAKKMEVFIMGLREDIQGRVEAHFPTTYALALSIALFLDKESSVKTQQQASQGQFSGQKRNFDQSRGHQKHGSSQRHFQGNRQHQNTSGQTQGYTYPQCRYCLKYHTGQCLEKKCFSCNKEGHIAAQCPTNATPLNQRSASKSLPPLPRQD